jgi:hypothetical protein
MINRHILEEDLTIEKKEKGIQRYHQDPIFHKQVLVLLNSIDNVLENHLK